MAAPRHGKKKAASSAHKKNKLYRKQRRHSASSSNHENKQRGYSTFPHHHAVDESVAEPLWVRFCNSILSNTSIRANLYLIGGLACSILGAQVVEYRKYFFTAEPKNVLNEYFVKLGWGWTLGMVLPFSLICGLVFDSWRGTVAAGVRCAIATGIWFGFTTLFDILRKTLDTDFDISGHAFILIWSNLFLVEEGKAYKGWESVKEAASDLHRPLLKYLIWPARFLLVAMTALSVLWDIMYFSTVLFYHTWEEKVIAIALALFDWLVIYRGIYGNIPLMPHLPCSQSARELERITKERSLSRVQ